MANRYIVGRHGRNVVIREIDPDSCIFTFDKRESWNHAKKIAQPARLARPKRPAADAIVFIDVDGNSTTIPDDKWKV